MKRLFHSLLALTLLVSLVLPTLADTIKLKDGSVIHGQVVGFKDGQFTVLIGSGAKGRRSRTLVYVEDIESIEFDSAGSNIASGPSNDDRNNSVEPVTQPSRPSPTPEPVNPNSQPANNQPTTSAPPTFFTIKVSVRADSANNGWTNTGLVVRRGQRLRITASGRVDLGKRGFSTPAGVPLSNDNDKLMRTEATGALIGVIGDDNDEFILVGVRREFVAQRDGVLFLGVNEGDLTDNRGTYDVVIEAEAGSSTPR
jgi:hypothetical protein